MVHTYRRESTICFVSCANGRLNELIQPKMENPNLLQMMDSINNIQSGSINDTIPRFRHHIAKTERLPLHLILRLTYDLGHLSYLIPFSPSSYKVYNLAGLPPFPTIRSRNMPELYVEYFLVPPRPKKDAHLADFAQIIIIEDVLFP